MVKDINKKVYKLKTPFGEKTFIFKMNRHFRGDDDTAMRRIAEWISNNAESPGWLKGPLWFLLNVRIAHITPSHALWSLLDDDAQQSPSRKLSYVEGSY